VLSGTSSTTTAAAAKRRCVAAPSRVLRLRMTLRRSLAVSLRLEPENEGKKGSRERKKKRMKERRGACASCFFFSSFSVLRFFSRSFGGFCVWPFVFALVQQEVAQFWRKGRKSLFTYSTNVCVWLICSFFFEELCVRRGFLLDFF